jgi:hypothetical protein
MAGSLNRRKVKKMKTENKYFVVTYTNGLYIRSAGKKENNHLGEDFELAAGDVIHAIGVEVTAGITFHKFDRIYRNGIRYDLPFDKFPDYQASPTGEYWSGEKDSNHVWMTETNEPDLSKKQSGNKSGNDSLTTSGKKYVGWRVLHYAEGGYNSTPLNMPEVIPPVVQLALPMTNEIQQMSFALMKHFNSAIDKKLWTNVHHGDRAFTNANGFGSKAMKKWGGVSRANFITGEDLKNELPKYDKMGRVCGGMFIRGTVQGGFLVCQPGVHGVHGKKPMPDIQTIIDKNWYFIAVVRYATSVGHFPQGQGGPVAIPFIFDREVKFPISLFEKWEADELPDPLKLYNK